MSNILFVCTANICRSPAAEAMAWTRFGATGHEYASAGFLFEDRPIEPDMDRALQSIGVDASRHRSSMVSPINTAGADLVLTMEARHVQDLTLMSPDLLATTLPLMEAAERLRGRRVDVPAFVQELSGRSPMVYLESKWDVEDPYKRSKRKYRKAVEQISDLVDDVLSALAPG